jgi:cyanophycinase-like exopeptidase
MDLDQKAMETQNSLSTDAGFANAKNIYINGGNSGSYAEVTLAVPLTQTITVGTAITGVSATASIVTGVAFEQAAAGATTLKVRYTVGVDVAPCAVGGLQATSTAGCKSNVTVTSVTFFCKLT